MSVRAAILPYNVSLWDGMNCQVNPLCTFHQEKPQRKMHIYSSDRKSINVSRNLSLKLHVFWWKYKILCIISETTNILRLTTLRCTRPPQSQSGAIFCHLNHHCVVFKSARQLFKKITKRYFTKNTLRIMHLEHL